MSITNDNNKFPHHEVHIDENLEFFVEAVVDHKTWGKGRHYLVKFQGYPDSFNHWLSGKDLDGDTALEKYLIAHPLSS